MLSTLRSAARLRKALTARGYSTRALAARLSEDGYPVSYQRVGQLRVGNHPRVTSELGVRIEQALGVPAGELFAPGIKPPRADKGVKRS